MSRLLLTLSLMVFGAHSAPQRRPEPRQHFQPVPRQPFQSVAPVNNNVPPQFPQQPRQRTESADYEEYQNQNANYQFSSNIEDHINGLTNQRQEVREGSAVKGSYSYSDGYFKITVSYIADENGYRVTGMEAVPLSGPQVDLKGTASVSSMAHGAHLRYRVASVPVPVPLEKNGKRHNHQFPEHHLSNSN